MAQNQAVCAAGASGGVLGPVLRRISKLCGLRQVSSCLKLACDFQNKPGGNCLCCVRLGAHAVHSEALRCAGGALRPSSQRWPIRFVDVLRFKVASCPPAAPSPQSNASDDIREHPARTLMQLKLRCGATDISACKQDNTKPTRSQCARSPRQLLKLLFSTWIKNREGGGQRHERRQSLGFPRGDSRKCKWCHFQSFLG